MSAGIEVGIEGLSVQTVSLGVLSLSILYVHVSVESCLH